MRSNTSRDSPAVLHVYVARATSDLPTRTLGAPFLQRNIFRVLLTSPFLSPPASTIHLSSPPSRVSNACQDITDVHLDFRWYPKQRPANLLKALQGTWQKDSVKATKFLTGAFLALSLPSLPLSLSFTFSYIVFSFLLRGAPPRRRLWDGPFSNPVKKNVMPLLLFLPV